MRAYPSVFRSPIRWRRAQYRVRQFWQGLAARVSPEEHDLVAAALPPAALGIFTRMPVDAQRHSLNVLYAVRQAGIVDADLDAAALLHDAGKLAADEAGVRLSPWLRGPLVLLEAWAPAILHRAAHANPTLGWRYAVYVHFEHPRLGAEQARRAGCSELTCWLIEHHQGVAASVPCAERERLLLEALQRADDAY